MKKIRINELARELEVKSREILDRLKEMGVTEALTHSSSIDEDTAITLRRAYGRDVPDAEPAEAEPETEAEPKRSAPSAPPEAGPAAKVEEPAVETQTAAGAEEGAGA